MVNLKIVVPHVPDEVVSLPKPSPIHVDETVNLLKRVPFHVHRRKLTAEEHAIIMDCLNPDLIANPLRKAKFQRARELFEALDLLQR